MRVDHIVSRRWVPWEAETEKPRSDARPIEKRGVVPLLESNIRCRGCRKKTFQSCGFPCLSIAIPDRHVSTDMMGSRWSTLLFLGLVF